MSILDLIANSNLGETDRCNLMIKALSVCDQNLKGDGRDNAMAHIMDLVERAKSRQDIGSRINAARLVG